VTKKPYVLADLQASLAKLTKNPKFAADFFSKYITGTEKIDYAPLLEKAGYLLKQSQPGVAWIGNIGGAGGGGGRGRAGGAAPAAVAGVLTITGNTQKGTPIYKAGIEGGDIILTADGKDMKSTQELADIVAAKKPGDKIAVTYKNRAGQHNTTITVEESPAVQVVSFESSGKTLTKEQQDFRTNWLSSKAK